MRKLSRKGWVKKLDDLLREAIRLIYDNKCFICGKPVKGQGSHPHHIVPKSKGYAIRWYLPNMLLLCTHCHFGWHNDAAVSQNFRAKYPHRWELAQAERNKIIDRNKVEEFLINKQLELEVKIKELKNEKSN